MDGTENTGVRAFISYLEQRQKRTKPNGKSILVEMQSNKSAQIAQSIFVEILNRNGNSVVAFSPYVKLSRVRSSLKKAVVRAGYLRVDSWPIGVYKAMGIKQFLFIGRGYLSFFEKRKLLTSFSNMTKEEILNFSDSGIRIGDLFYDWYLRTSGLPTINQNSRNCQKEFITFIKSVRFWDNYFSSHTITDVLVTHSVYEQGIPARFGLRDNLGVYLVTSDRCFKLTNEDYLSDLEFKYYNYTSNDFNSYEMNLNKAEKKLKDLFDGNMGVDIAHSFVSGLRGRANAPIISRESKVRVLIASHCFSDSPHANGDHIFPDFWEWLTFLSQIARGTDYSWYIKAHPAFFDSDKVIFEEFCRLNPHITPVSSDYSNKELIQQGINVVLTVYGTIAFEAAYLGAIVIDASRNTPHMNYNFTLKPNNHSEYKALLGNLSALVDTSSSIDRDEILHFYDVHHLRKSENWLFDIYYDEMLLKLQSVEAQYSDERVYDFWIRLSSETSHLDNLGLKIRSFIESGRYVF